MELRLLTTRKQSLGGSSGRFALGTDPQPCQGKDFDLPSASGKDTAFHQPAGNPNRSLDTRSRQLSNRGAGLWYHPSELFVRYSSR